MTCEQIEAKRWRFLPRPELIRNAPPIALFRKAANKFGISSSGESNMMKKGTTLTPSRRFARRLRDLVATLGWGVKSAAFTVVMSLLPVKRKRCLASPNETTDGRPSGCQRLGEPQYSQEPRWAQTLKGPLGSRCRSVRCATTTALSA